MARWAVERGDAVDGFSRVRSGMSTPASSSVPTPSPATPAAATGVPATPASTAPGGPKPIVTFEDFAKLDLRIARVVAAENHPKADRLLKLQLDDGSGAPRQICAGIKEQYTAEQMVGKLIVIVANLAPRVIRGEESRGMLLAASSVPKEAATPDTPRAVIVLGPQSEIAPGAIVS